VVLDRALELPVAEVHRGGPAAVGDIVTAVGFGGEDTSQLNPRTERAVDVTAVGQWIRTFTVSEGPCEGDSGGPALAVTGELVGVFSSVSMDCTNANASAKYTDVSFFSPLIEAAFEAAGAGSPWPTAEGGAGGALAVDPAGAGTESAGAGAGTGSADAPAGSGPDDSGCALRGSPAGGTPWAALLVFGLFLAARGGRHAWRRRK
jgi:hypothetical protein